MYLIAGTFSKQNYRINSRTLLKACEVGALHGFVPGKKW